MKKLFIPLAALCLIIAGCAPDLTEEFDALKKDVTTLQEQVKDLQNQIDAVKKLAEAASNNESITDYQPIKDTDGNIIGYTIYFTNMDPIEIYYGEDGVDGKDGAPGKDGKDGEPGKDGKDGKDGADGAGGDSYLVDFIDNGDTVTLVFADGTKITLPKDSEPLPPITVKPLFGFQPTVENPHGMTADAHRTIAVVGDYLIVSNAYDFSKMLVYNRFTGEFLGDNLVNTSTVTGLDSTYQFWAIASDDAGHLVMINFVDSRETPLVNCATVRGWVWKDGVTAAPVSKWWAGFYNYGTGASYAFSNLKVAGDLTADAVIGTTGPQGGVAVFEAVTGGNPGTRLKKALPNDSWWWSGNVIPLNGDAKEADAIKFIHVSGDHNQIINYNNEFNFNLSDSYWYMGGGKYQKSALGGDYISAGSHKLLALLNGWYAASADTYGNNRMYMQLVVSDITATPTADSFTEGLIFASRHSENEEGVIEGMGLDAGAQAMMSPFAYEGTVLGANALAANVDRIGDVALATSEGGKKVQVYGFAMNLGLIAYEITFND